jgi:eukaryotic-like serine/threonine-protein kinase
MDGRATRSNASVMPSDPHQAAPAAPPSKSTTPLRSFSRFRLLRLLGRSERTMAWLVADPRSGKDLMLVLPRVQLTDAAAAEHWAQAVRKAARLQHPHIAVATEVGVHDGWPYAAYDPSDVATLSDRIGKSGLPITEAVAIACQALQGLAYAHDAGIGHHDLQSYLILVTDQGDVRLAGLEVAVEVAAASQTRGVSGVESGALRAQRDAAERDVLSLGLVLHHALTGQHALDDPDVGHVISRLPPEGNEVVRLPWATPQPIPDVLRAIANRATDRQERQRYRNARTLERALEGWLRSDDNSGAGPLAMLLERLGTVGMLPASPGGAERAARLALMDRQRTNELAAVILDDLALTFELLRNVNSAQLRAAQASGGGPVLTVRRAVAMLGMDGVRRAALALRAWPGPLAEAQSHELAKTLDKVKRAARLAVEVRPAGYDAEVVYILTVLQNLGRLVVQYHCADEAQQIRRLMVNAPPERPGEPPIPGMSEEAAAFSVLGVDIEAIGLAIAKRWGLDEELLQVLRRWPSGGAVRAAEGDNDILRSIASCANELADMDTVPPGQQQQTLGRIAQRYARTLHLGPKELQTALQETLNSSTADAVLADTNHSSFAPL